MSNVTKYMTEITVRNMMGEIPNPLSELFPWVVKNIDFATSNKSIPMTTINAYDCAFE